MDVMVSNYLDELVSTYCICMMTKVSLLAICGNDDQRDSEQCVWLSNDGSAKFYLEGRDSE